MWKQDPTVEEIGVRMTYIPTKVYKGPSDARIAIKGLPEVVPNINNDFLTWPPGTDAFDSIHTFAVVKMTLLMAQRAGGTGLTLATMPWQWNNANNADPLSVYPHGLPGVQNAYYSRSDKVLKFGDFNYIVNGVTKHAYTCRSLDVVSHETGHAILDGLKPGWLGWGNPPQTGGLHEAFGDLIAVFLALSQADLAEALIVHTKGNLHKKNFLAMLAEEFGTSIGHNYGLRNADNDLKLSQVGTEVHAISQVFTGAIYDIMADIFELERNPPVKDDTMVLIATGHYLFELLLKALIHAPDSKATYVDVAKEMIKQTVLDHKPDSYRKAIYERFKEREIVLTMDLTKTGLDFTKMTFAPNVTDAVDAVQDRSGCCGTMQLAEYLGEEDSIEAEIKAFKESMKKKA
jgi:hypothetical protein